jgi:hypothetical protein
MPVLLGLIAVIGTGVYFFFRARDAANIAGELVDVAKDVRSAARRFGFRRRTNVHPVDSIEDLDVAVAATAGCFLEMDDLPTRDQRDMLMIQVRCVLRLSESDAREVLVLGRWLAQECGNADQAVSRLATKAYKLGGHGALSPIETIVSKTLNMDRSTPSAHQLSALDDVRYILRAR